MSTSWISFFFLVTRRPLFFLPYLSLRTHGASMTSTSKQRRAEKNTIEKAKNVFAVCFRKRRRQRWKIYTTNKTIECKQTMTTTTTKPNAWWRLLLAWFECNPFVHAIYFIMRFLFSFAFLVESKGKRKVFLHCLFWLNAPFHSYILIESEVMNFFDHPQ